MEILAKRAAVGELAGLIPTDAAHPITRVREEGLR